ncbi:hypothetical protein J3R83DRAFT_2335 [Lanmaoa asiatica]|nr:hypothetical protein J3R83DRAFT_2335 [Lanmaoa asiatica]
MVDSCSKVILPAPSQYTLSAIMVQYIGCDHKRFVRLRVMSEKAYTWDKNMRSGMGCVVSEESKLWSNGQVIAYSFVDSVNKSKLEVLPYPRPGDDGKMKFAIKAMQEYERYTNVKFERVEDPKSAAIRISFKPNELWTTIGTDALMVSETEATMNLALLKPGKSSENERTIEDINTTIALHAFGHVLGLYHEMDVKVPDDITFIPQRDIKSRDESITQHFAYSHDKRPISNFGEVDKQSIMKYLVYTAEGTNIDPDINLSLSDNDKAWLTLHYPKPEVNKPVDAETWVFQKALGQLLGKSDKYRDILRAGDVSERRSIYLQFLHSKWSEREIPLSDTGKIDYDLIGPSSELVSVLDEDVVREVKKALDKYRENDKDRLKRLAARGDRLAWQLQVHTAPQTVPAWMPDGNPLDPVQIQHSIHDLLRLIGRPAAPELQHFLTHEPDDEQRQLLFNIAEVSRATLETQLANLETQLKNVGNREAKLEETTKLEIARIKRQIDAMEKLLAEERRPEQVQAAAQVGLDGLVRSIEGSIPKDADVTGADIQQFITWIPAMVQGIKLLGGALGLSINSNEAVDFPEDVQQGIFGDAWKFMKRLPVKDLVNVGKKIADNISG